MIRPHIHVPYDAIDRYLGFLRQDELDLEIYFGTRHFDAIRTEDVSGLIGRLGYAPGITLHSPFMDLSPGAVDPRVRRVTFERFSDVIGYAEILRAKVVVFHSGYEKWKYDRRVDIWLEESLKTWVPLSKRASERGIKIAIENIVEDEPSHLRLLVQEMNTDSFGLCFDTGHFNLFSTTPLTSWIEQVRSSIIELHLHDNLKVSDDHLAIGDGSFDFAALFGALQGKELVYTIEAHTVEDVNRSRERLRDYFK